MTEIVITVKEYSLVILVYAVLDVGVLAAGA
jgi:hypothetical protein